MLTRSAPNTKRLRQILAPLTPISLEGVCRPNNLETARDNLKRFYGCVDGHLVVLLSNLRYDGRKVRRAWEGVRRDGKWQSASLQLNARSTPHDSVMSAVSCGDYCSVTIDIDRISNLTELFYVTESGQHYGTFDFLITLNLVLGGSSPFLEEQKSYYKKLGRLLEASHQKVGGRYHHGVWVADETSYSLFSNDDAYLQRYGGFFNYASENGMYWRWRSLYEPHTRVIDWALLGDFGLHPSENGHSDNIQLAA